MNMREEFSALALSGVDISQYMAHADDDLTGDWSSFKKHTIYFKMDNRVSITLKETSHDTKRVH